MVHQRGGGRVFPVQFLTIRKGRDGVARSIFLSPEESTYCSQVLNLYRDSIGKRKEEIEVSIKELELKSQNPKIIKGLALILDRASRFEQPSILDPLHVREVVFSSSSFPPVSPEERSGLLKTISVRLHSSPEEIVAALYADKESEQVLRDVPVLSTSDLANMFNLEQIETVMLKSSSFILKTSGEHQRFIRKIRSLGLLYEESAEGEMHTLKVTGPVSIFEHSDRYGSRLALLIRYVAGFSDWEIDADVILKSGKEKSSYSYHIDSTVSPYIGSPPVFSNNGKSKPAMTPEPIRTPNGTIFPDYVLNIYGHTENVVLTRPRYYEEDYAIIRSAMDAHDNISLICVIDSEEKCPKGATCIKGEVEAGKIAEILGILRKNEARSIRSTKVNEPKNSTVDMNTKKLDTNMIHHLESLYPESQEMVEYLDFMGFNPESALIEAGYKVKWKGLHMVVYK